MTTLREQLEVARQLNSQQQRAIEDYRTVVRSRDERFVKLGEEIQDQKIEIKKLEQQIQWHKTMNQNLIEAVIAHAKGR